MRVKFKLDMPSNNSWNNKWSGAGKEYFKIVTVGEKKGQELIKDGGYYTYSFGDGWMAGITATQAKGRQPKSAGFCGYDWMIDSILYYGEISTPQQRKLAIQNIEATNDN